MRRCFDFIAVAAVLAGLLLSGLPARSADRGDQLFEQVLANPDDPSLNVAFAAEAEARGDLRHALAALERARNARPGDPEIEAAYNRVRRRLLPTVTSGTIEAGVSVASNPLQEPSRRSRPSDTLLDAAFTLDDERTVLDTRLRTTVTASGQWFNQLHQLESGRLSITSGPVYMLSNETWLQIAPGASHFILEGQRLYDEASAAVTLGGLLKGLSQSVTVRGGWRRGNEDLLYSDSSFLAVEGRFAARPDLLAGDIFYIQPRYYLNHAIDPFPDTVFSNTVLGNSTAVARDLAPLSFQEFGGRLTYFVPLAGGRVYLGAGVSVYERFYDSFVLDAAALAQGVPLATGEKRRDLYIEPTAHLVFPRLISPAMDLRFDYRFEDNLSNDNFREYQNHVAGVRIVGRF